MRYAQAFWIVFETRFTDYLRFRKIRNIYELFVKITNICSIFDKFIVQRLTRYARGDIYPCNVRLHTRAWMLRFRYNMYYIRI